MADKKSSNITSVENLELKTEDWLVLILKSRSNQDFIVKNAEEILKTVPITKAAVFDFFSGVFDDAVNIFFQINFINMTQNDEKREHEIMKQDLFTAIERIKDLFHVLINKSQTNKRGWSPIIAAWSLDMLGHICKTYSEKMNLSATATNLDIVTQAWLNCLPTKILVDITAECFQFMYQIPNVDCKVLLWEKCIQNSPFFDWIVSYVGSCFPNEITNLMLKLTLKDLTSSGHFHLAKDKSQIQSVTGILTQLCYQNRKNVCNEILKFIKESVDGVINEKSYHVVPFICHIMSLSNQLYHVFSPYFLELINNNFMNKLAQQLSGNIRDWKSVNSAAIQNIYNLSNSNTSIKALEFMLSSLTNTNILPPVREQSTFLLEQFINSLQRELHGSKFTWPKNGGPPQAVPFEIPFLDSLRSNSKTLVQLFLKTESGQKRAILQKLITCLAIYHGTSLAADLLSHIIIENNAKELLGLAISMQEEIEPRLPKVFPETIQRIINWFKLERKESDLIISLENIYSLCKWEKSLRKNKLSFPTRTQAFELFQNDLSCFSNLLLHENRKVSDIALLVLLQIGLPLRPSNVMLIRLVRCLVSFIFETLDRPDSVEKNDALLNVKKLVGLVCKNTTANRIFIRQFLEDMLNDNYCHVIGSEIPVERETNYMSNHGELEKQIKNLDAPYISKKLHTGMNFSGNLGGPFRKENANNSVDEKFLKNRMILVQILHKASIAVEPDTLTSNSEEIGSQTAHFISLLLVELICPDVMYNGIQWPEEDCMKITVERDIVITKKFKKYPILWDIMDLMSTTPGAMCYCSSILRALFAIQLSYWNSCQNKDCTKEQTETICKILDLMTKGNLIPEILNNTVDIINYVAPFEIYRLLQNIWNYVKENPPIPERRRLKTCDSRYTEIIKSVIHAHINILAPHFVKFLNID